MTIGPLKTSEEWLKIYKDDKPNFQLLDPDGWDRRNYKYSFYEEKITNMEFMGRIIASTVSDQIIKPSDG